MNDKQIKTFINKVFENGWFQILFQVAGLFPKKVRAQVFPNNDKHYMILVYFSVQRLRDINVDEGLSKKQIVVIPLEEIKDIKPGKAFGINSFSFSTTKNTYKFLSKRNSEAWIFRLQHPDKPVTFSL